MIRVSPFLVVLALALVPGRGDAAAGPGPIKLDSDAWNMPLLSRVSPGLPRRVALRDPIAFVALDSGLEIYDVTDPANPYRLGGLYLPSVAYDLVLDGGHAFVACGEAGLQVIDILDPARPFVAAALPLAGTARGIAVAGGVAYLAAAAERPAPVYGLHTVDVANPLAPAALGFAALPNGALDVAIVGTTALVGIGSNPGRTPLGLAVVDVALPADPVVLAGATLDFGQPVNEIVVAGGVAYLAAGLASSGALLTVDVANPRAPVVRGQAPLADGALGVAIQGGFAFVAARTLGVVAVDIANPAAPVRRGAVQTGRETVGVAARAGAAILAERSSIERAALTGVSTLAPGAMVELGCVGFAEATGSAAAGGLALLLGRDALSLYDAANPAAPLPLSTWRPPAGDLTAVAVQGALAAVADGRVVHLIDLADPLNPVEAGQAQVGFGMAVQAVLDAGRLYVSTGLGVEAFDLASPSAPVLLWTYRATGWVSGLAVSGGIAYLAEGDTLHLLDLAAVPPATVGTMTVAGEALHGVAVAPPLLAVTGLGNLLYAVDVANPAAPMLSGFVSGGTGFEVRLAGNRALVAAGEAGVLVVNLVDPMNPFVEGGIDLPGATYALANDGATILAPANGAAHFVLSCGTCGGSSCTDTWPVIQPNSLKVGRVAGEPILEWTIQSGSGASNVHLTLDPAELPALDSVAGTVAGIAPLTRFADGYRPAVGAPAFYRVFGRSSCTGQSRP